MRVAIDAANIRAGGGVTHLVELLRVAEPQAFGIGKILIWACASTLAQIEDRPWLEKRTDPALEANLLKRVLWQRFGLSKLLQTERIDLLFVPGGSIIPSARPAVTMSRNMLPFEWNELRRFGWSLTALKLVLLRRYQANSFRNAEGTIFLTRYAHDKILKITGPLRGETAIVPHGIDDRFRRDPRPQRAVADVTMSDPLRVAYVSIVDAHKHQWTVIEAIGRLRREGLPIRLDLYGPARDSILPRLTGTLQRVDPEGEFIRYWGAIDYNELDKRYAAADICVFASSCENLPNILIESMAAALPIACSDRGPMPEVLGDAGVYFDPEDSRSIANAVRTLALDPILRAKKAVAAQKIAAEFSWLRCSRETLAFLSTIGRERS